MDYDEETDTYKDAMSKIELLDKKNKKVVLGYVEFDLGSYCKFPEKRIDNMPLKMCKYDATFEIEI
jgi:hypothetical protein